MSKINEIEEKLDYLQQTKALLKEAIVAKGGVIAEDAEFRDYVGSVEGISTGVPINNQDKTITENGTYTADEGYTGLGTVTVDVAASGGGDSEQVFIDIIEGNETAGPLPSGLTKIGDYAFYNSSNLALTSLPEGITSIGNNAFYNCDSVELTALPEGITSIGRNAFYNCSNLALTSLPEGITSIGNSAFYYCSNLTELTFEGKPTTIPSSAFNSCTNLLAINVPWAEGEVANAPWGATNAQINYNYTGA